MSKLLPMLDPFDEIKKLYYTATRETIDRDLKRALDLLAHMPDDDARQRAAGLMHGLSDLQREWKPKGRKPGAASRTKDKGQRRKDKGQGPKADTA